MSGDFPAFLVYICLILNNTSYESKKEKWRIAGF